jgi:sortase A
MVVSPEMRTDCSTERPEPISDRARKSRRRSTTTLVIGVLLVLVGLGASGYVVWGLFGTTVIAKDHSKRELERFYEEHPAGSHSVTDLRTGGNGSAPPVPDISAGGTWGVMFVPRWEGAEGVYGETLSNRIPIAQGTGRDVLDNGWAGHYEGTAPVGQIGNFALAAHRRSYGENFRHLDKLRTGDPIVIETPETWYVYEVTGAPETVAPSAVEEIAPVPHHPGARPTKRLITLTTCTSTSVGEWGNDHRLSVHAELVGWSLRSDGVPPQLSGIAGAEAVTAG